MRIHFVCEYWNVKRCALPLQQGMRFLIKEQFISPTVFSSWFMHIKFYLYYTLHMEMGTHTFTIEMENEILRRAMCMQWRIQRQNEKKSSQSKWKSHWDTIEKRFTYTIVTPEMLSIQSHISTHITHTLTPIRIQVVQTDSQMQNWK